MIVIVLLSRRPAELGVSVTVLIAASWVQPELGGPSAMLRVEENVVGFVDTIGAQSAIGELQTLDHLGKGVPW